MFAHFELAISFVYHFYAFKITSLLCFPFNQTQLILRICFLIDDLVYHTNVALQNQLFGLCIQQRHRSAWASTMSVQSLYCLHEESLSDLEYSQTCVSDHIKHGYFWLFTGGCLLLHERSAESSCMSFLHYFHSAISNHLSITISMLPELVVA